MSRHLAEFLQMSPVMQVGSRDVSLVPEAVRAAGYRFGAEPRDVRVFVPRATGARTIANLRAYPRVAVVAAHPLDHRSLQFKGDVVGIGDCDEEDREAMVQYLAGAGGLLELAGMPRSITRRVASWPAWAIEIAVTDVFDQTPGPGAGEPLRGPPSLRFPGGAT